MPFSNVSITVRVCRDFKGSEKRSHRAWVRFSETTETPYTSISVSAFGHHVISAGHFHTKCLVSVLQWAASAQRMSPLPETRLRQPPRASPTSASKTSNRPTLDAERSRSQSKVKPKICHGSLMKGGNVKVTALRGLCTSRQTSFDPKRSANCNQISFHNAFFILLSYADRVWLHGFSVVWWKRYSSAVSNHNVFSQEI